MGFLLSATSNKLQNIHAAFLSKIIQNINIKRKIHNGAYRFLKDKDGYTPEQEAAENDHEAVQSLLETPGRVLYSYV